MSKEDSHPIRNGVLVTVIGGVILSLIPYTRDLFVKIIGWIWDKIVTVATAFWTHLTSSVDIPWYLLWPLILLACPAIYRLVKRLLPHRNQEPKKSDYTEDIIFKIN